MARSTPALIQKNIINQDDSNLEISEADSEIEEDNDELVVDSRIGRILSEKIV